jgi:serine acetyltransferase
MISLRDLFNIVQLEFSLAKGFRISSVIVLFRLASYAFYGQSVIRHFFQPIAIFYKIYTEFFLGIELPARTKVGVGLCIYHAVGLVVHKGVIIGNNCVLRQGVTIGNRGEGGAANLLPVIGNNVEFGAGAIVIGNVKIGDNVMIGAGAVVTKDIPPNSVVVGPAFRILDRKS